MEVIDVVLELLRSGDPLNYGIGVLLLWLVARTRPKKMQKALTKPSETVEHGQLPVSVIRAMLEDVFREEDEHRIRLRARLEETLGMWGGTKDGRRRIMDLLDELEEERRAG